MQWWRIWIRHRCRASVSFHVGVSGVVSGTNGYLFFVGHAGVRGEDPAATAATTPIPSPKKKTMSVSGAGGLSGRRVARGAGVTEVKVAGRKAGGSSAATATASQPSLRSKKSMMTVEVPSMEEVKKSVVKVKREAAAGIAAVVAAVAGTVSVGVLVYEKLTDVFV